MFHRFCFRSFFLIAAAPILLILGNCSKSGRKEPELFRPANLSPVHPGKTERFHCIKDTFFTYTAFTPSKYSDQVKWPVMFIFDPHARGLLPVRRYSQIADRYGYILIASNDSKNGTPPEYTGRILDNLLNDSRQRWNTDQRRQYLLGFSGGARAASHLMNDHRELAGCIGSGAGFPSVPGQPLPYVYAGLIGTRDFNYSEMLLLNESADTLSGNHLIIEFDGGHDWPPQETMRTAFDWLDISAMKQNLIPVDETRLKAIADTHDLFIRNAIISHQPGKATLIHRRLIRMLDNLYDTREHQESLAELERLYAVHDFFKARRLILRTESNRQKEYQELFAGQNLQWWKSEISKLRKPPREKPAHEYQTMNQRLLQYISMLAFIHSQRALNDNRLDDAERFLNIYRLADPDNPDQRFLKACYWIKRNETDKAIAALRESAALGFSDTEKMDNDPILSPLKKHPDFISLQNLIRKNSEEIH